MNGAMLKGWSAMLVAFKSDLPVGSRSRTEHCVAPCFRFTR